MAGTRRPAATTSRSRIVRCLFRGRSERAQKELQLRATNDSNNSKKCVCISAPQHDDRTSRGPARGPLVDRPAEKETTTGFHRSFTFMSVANQGVVRSQLMSRSRRHRRRHLGEPAALARSRWKVSGRRPKTLPSSLGPATRPPAPRTGPDGGGAQVQSRTRAVGRSVSRLRNASTVSSA
jgi:hypothetical protein